MRRGDVLRVHTLRGRWGVPQVTLRGDDGGLSADGSTLVLARWPSSRLPARSRFAVLDLRRMRTRIVTIAGAFSFDALSPDGRRLYLIEQLSARDLTR